MAENRSPEKTKAPATGAKPRVGMYDRPEKTNRLSPMLLAGIVIIVLLLVLAFYFIRF